MKTRRNWYAGHQTAATTTPNWSRKISAKSFRTTSSSSSTRCVEFDRQFREAKARGDYLRSQRNSISKQHRRPDGERPEGRGRARPRPKCGEIAEELGRRLKRSKTELSAKIRERMLVIPNIIDQSVPIGQDDSENVEVERFGEPAVPDFEVPYHVDIMERLDGIDLDSARKTQRQRVLLPDGRYRAAALGGSLLRARFHDRPRLHLLRPALHDPQRTSSPA